MQAEGVKVAPREKVEGRPLNQAEECLRLANSNFGMLTAEEKRAFPSEGAATAALEKHSDLASDSLTEREIAWFPYTR